MRILLLTQWFEPEPSFKGLLFAQELAARGHDVEVLTGFPNYPGGHLYSGYKLRLWQRERIDGISVLRVPLFPSHDKSTLGRILNYVSFAIAAAFIGAVLIRKPDVMYVYHPPATVGFAAVVIGFLRKAPFIYDICDLWPDTVAVSGMLRSRTALAVLDKWCMYLYHRAGQIAVASPGFKEQLVRRGVAPGKIAVIYNWCDAAAIMPRGANLELASGLGLLGLFNVMFAGTMGTAQALDSVLDAAALCRQALPNVQFVLVGGGVERNRLERKAADLGLTNALFLPRQPMADMGNVLALADVLLVHLKSHSLFTITIPSKTQAYMASGKPLLMAVYGDAAQLVIQSGCGLVCEPENPASIAAAVAHFARMSPEERRSMGESGKRFYDSQLSLKIGVTQFETLFTKAAQVPVSAARHSSKRSECLSLRTSSASVYQRLGKRLFDLVLTVPTLVLIWPVILLIGLCSRLFLGRLVLFRQKRLGRNEKPFTMYKFRTMRSEVDSHGASLPDERRVTPFGSFLRRTSLDELPQLWNVLKGDMSLIGPRPLLLEYLPRYTLFQRRRHGVKPGISGWVQVNGRNRITWEQKFELDVWYVDHLSLWLDVRILWMTTFQILRRDGISQAGHATMPEFMGSPAQSRQDG